MPRSRSQHCRHPGCQRPAVQGKLCCDHAAETLSDDPLRLLYFGLIDGQPIADAERAALLARARECWYEACFAVQAADLDSDFVDLAASTMDWSLVLASWIWQQERVIQRGAFIDSALKRKTNRAAAQLEIAMNDLARRLAHSVH